MTSQPSSPADPLLKILLVENSRTARAVLVKQLLNNHHQVDAVGSGTEAIQAINESDYHIVIMDVFLPQMNGYEAAQHIRSIDSDKSKIPLIGFSSSTSEKDKQICFNAGMNEYVIKSADNAELLAVLHRYKTQIFASKLIPGY